MKNVLLGVGRPGAVNLDADEGGESHLRCLTSSVDGLNTDCAEEQTEDRDGFKKVCVATDRRLVRRFASWPDLVVLGAAAAGTVVWGLLNSRSGIDGDVFLFASAGSRMLSGGWTHTFANADVQAGPAELALTSLALKLGDGRGGFAVILDLISTAAIITAGAWFLRGSTRGLIVLVIGAFLFWFPSEGYQGHPAELLIPVLWFVAAARSRGDHPLQAGAIVGLAACIELWGILGITALALSPQLRRAVSGAALAGGMMIASLLPFAVAGDFHMFDYRWRTTSGIDYLLLHGQPFTWYDRVAEAALVLVIGFTVARGTRRLRESIWIVPAATALARLALDPLRNYYYWDVPLVLLLIGASAILARPRELRLRLATHLGRT
jgi:hypothetical protein